MNLHEGTAAQDVALPISDNEHPVFFSRWFAMEAVKISSEDMFNFISRALFSLFLLAQSASAQTVVRNDENLATDRPEAWAMNYVAASTLMTAFGETPALPSWSWRAALELGAIPHLSEAQRRVGFDGYKEEDLNKSPVFGRLRLSLGLPAGWVAEFGYAPPVTINGVRPQRLVAAAIGRRLIEFDGGSVSVRGFAQNGAVVGDITCPARLAAIADLQQNPYGCRAPSEDRITLNYYGLDMTASWHPGVWNWHATAGAVRTNLLAQVDALVFDQRDRSQLEAHSVLPYFAVGAGRQVDQRWSWGAEVLHVPLSVKRRPDRISRPDPYTGLRMVVNYRLD